MADVSKIRVDGVDYDVKDATARTEITPIERGGTGSTTQSQALSNLKAAPQAFVSYEANVNTTDELDNALQTMYNLAGYGGVKIGRINDINGNTTFGGGEWLIIVSNSWQQYGFAIAIKYTNNNAPYIFTRSYWNKNWGNWVKTVNLPTVTTSDNGKILKVVNGVWTAVAE